MGALPDKYLTDWSKKRDAWLRSGRKDDSCLLRDADLSAFRALVISEPQLVTSTDRGFLLASDRRADTSQLMRSQDVEALQIETTEISMVAESPTIPPVSAQTVSAQSAAEPGVLKRPGPRKRWTVVLLAVNVVLVLSMLGLGWLVKDRLVLLHESKGELQRTQATLITKTEAIGQAHDDLAQQSKAKAALEKVLPEVKAQRDDVSKALDTLTQERRAAEEQLKAVEYALAIAQAEIGNQRGRRPKGKLKVEFDRLLIKRLLLRLPLRCPKDLAECTDEAITESVRKLIPNGSLRELISPLPHVVIYPRSAAKNAKLLPLREGMLRKLVKLPGDKSDLLVMFCPRLPEEKGAKAEARYQSLLEFLRKGLKFKPERLLRINQAGLFANGMLKGLAPADRPKNGEGNPAEAIWVVRAPGPNPIAAAVVPPN